MPTGARLGSGAKKGQWEGMPRNPRGAPASHTSQEVDLSVSVTSGSQTFKILDLKETISGPWGGNLFNEFHLAAHFPPLAQYKRKNLLCKMSWPPSEEREPFCHVTTPNEKWSGKTFSLKQRTSGGEEAKQEKPEARWQRGIATWRDSRVLY